MNQQQQDRGAGPGYASPQDAIQNAPREEFVYVAGLYEGTGVQEPDFLAVVDVTPQSDTYSQIIHRTSMPNVGDELHHYGWQACSSAHSCNHIARDHLVVPGFRSSRIHILNVSADPRRSEIATVIEPAEVIRKTGYSLHIWDLEKRTHQQTIELGDTGLVPLEVRWLHDPEANEAFVPATLSSTLWHVHRNGTWVADKVAEVEPIELPGWPIPVPGLITDAAISMDDRFLYFSNWFHGDLRQYDISDPAHPRLNGQVWLGGLEKKGRHGDRVLDGGPQMLQLSMDGHRLYVTNSLYSTWDNQFYPDLESWLLKVDVADDGTMSVDPSFYVDFSALPGRPRSHEIHLPGGDVTTEIFA